MIIVNLAQVRSIEDRPDKKVCIYYPDSSDAFPIPAADVHVFGPGEMLVRFWLAEIARGTTEETT